MFGVFALCFRFHTPAFLVGKALGLLILLPLVVLGSSVHVGVIGVHLHGCLLRWGRSYNELRTCCAILQKVFKRSAFLSLRCKFRPLIAYHCGAVHRIAQLKGKCMQEPTNLVTASVKLAGGRARVAQALGVKPRTVDYWQSQRTVPPEHIRKLCELGQNCVDTDRLLSYIETEAEKKREK